MRPNISLRGGIPLTLVLFGILLILLALFRTINFGYEEWTFMNGIANTFLGLAGLVSIVYGVRLFLKTKQS